MLRGGAAAHLLHLLIHDTQLTIINDERDQQAHCPDELNDSLYYLNGVHVCDLGDLFVLCVPLAADDIDHSEYHHPHGVDEVPVPGDHLEALAVRSSDASLEAED